MKEEKRILNVLGQVDEKFIAEAAPGKRANKKPAWIKWTSIAACLALVAVLGVGALQGGWFSGNDIARLDNGTTINFVKCDAVGGSLSLTYDTTSRELTADEVSALFGDLPVTADAIFTVDEQAAGNAQKLIGFEGKIGEVKLIITTSDLPLLDTTIVGNEKATEVDGVSVTAGYFITDPNSRDEQAAIYYATFKIGSSTMYVENAGAKAESEDVKNDLVSVIQELIGNGELDLTSVETSEITVTKATFEAAVIEVQENALVIEPLEGTTERQFVEQIVVDTSDLGELNTVEYVAAAQIGDIIRVGYLAEDSDISKGQLAVYEIVFVKH